MTAAPHDEMPMNPDDFTPPDSKLRFEDVVGSPEIQDLATPSLKVGDTAVDFSLPELDASTGGVQETGRSFTLSAHAGHRPVALIFGSYT